MHVPLKHVGQLTRHDADRPFAQRVIEHAIVPQRLAHFGDHAQQRRAVQQGPEGAVYAAAGALDQFVGHFLLRGVKCWRWP